jgi:prepilin-type processing-associated H-X9-DG protein
LNSVVTWYTKASSFDKYKCLACDMLYTPALTSHYNSRRTEYTYNMVFMDGHVAVVHDKVLPKRGGTLWPAFPANGQPGAASAKASLTNLDDIIDILETEADGRDAATANADPKLTRFSSNATPYQNRLESSGTNGPGANSNHPAVPWL